jgi:adenylate kinase family enzyme
MCIVGPPGAGRERKVRGDKYGLTHLSTGDLFENISEKGRLGVLAKIMLSNEGRLVPDSCSEWLRIKSMNQKQYSRIYFDGFPRTTAG